jgi:hypothetical protein
MLALPAAQSGTCDACDSSDRPIEMRTFVRCMLHTLHPVTGLLRVNEVIDLDHAGMKVRPISESAVLAQVLFEGFTRDAEFPCEHDRPIPPPVDDHLAESLTCPYLQHQCVSKCRGVDTARLRDFGENLERLTLANKLYEMGERHRYAGDRDGAYYFFAQIHNICPGSRCDADAAMKMQEMAQLCTRPDDSVRAYAQQLNVTPPTHTPLESQPSLIDPKIVETLLKVLKEAGEFGVPRLILHVEEQSGSEEQENPETSEWRSQPNEVEFPSLFVDPVEDPLTITEEKEASEKNEDAPLDLTSLLQEVIDVIHSGQSVLVEKAGVGLDLELEVDLSGANVKVMTGYSGHRFVLVTLSPEASGDLRAAQRAHNERILNWIASLNEELFDCDAAEEEDADYGDAPVNEAIP